MAVSAPDAQGVIAQLIALFLAYGRGRPLGSGVPIRHTIPKAFLVVQLSVS